MFSNSRSGSFSLSGTRLDASQGFAASHDEFRHSQGTFISAAASHHGNVTQLLRLIQVGSRSLCIFVDGKVHYESRNHDRLGEPDECDILANYRL